MTTVYLDTSDLSCLLKGRGPPGTGDWGAHRARLEALITADRVQLYVSLIHVAEMAFKPSVAALALEWLERGVPVSIILTSSDAIFRAELSGASIAIVAMPLTRAMLQSQRVPLRIGPIKTSISGAQAARVLKYFTKMWAGAENLSKRARRRPASLSRQEHRAQLRRSDDATEDVIRGSTPSMPLPVQGLAKAFGALAPRVLATRGLTLDDVRRQVRLAPGRSWMTGLVGPAGWDAAQSFVRDPVRAPSSALRDAIENWEARDAMREARSSTVYDVNHAAYAGRCDVATIDGPNLRATAAVRAKLTRTRFYKTGKIDAVLDAIEAGA